MRYIMAFFGFWWDFLIGDTPELFIGMLLVLGVTALVAKFAVAAFVAPAIVALVLAASVTRAARTKTR